MRTKNLTIVHDVDELFPKNPQPLISEKVADMLLSQLTHAFEAALHQGMTPTDALGIILSWTSAEVMRVQAPTAGGYQR